MLNVEGCPSWLKERDWKSRVPLQGYREFESLALRHFLKSRRSGFRNDGFFLKTGGGVVRIVFNRV